jgi:hypothetical protein
MFIQEEIKKNNKLSSGVIMERRTRDGLLSILIKLNQFKLRDLQKNSDSTSTDHSTSDQDSQVRELLNAKDTTTSFLENGNRVRLDNISSSTE